jgi:hypothetical protein
MAFVYPAFLFGLAAILIPIIIHLFHFRRFKRVYFTNVRFLKEVKEQTASRSRLKHLLVLLSRILAITFLVFAFAQPFIQAKDQSASGKVEAVSIFLDNSFSMAAEGESEILFEKARIMAEEIAVAYGKETQFHLITHDLEGKHQRPMSLEQFNAFLSEISISPASVKLSTAQERMREVLADLNVEDASLFFISDFQKTQGLPEVDTTFSLNLLPLKGVNVENIYVDSVWFAEPLQLVNQTNALVVRIRNEGQRSYEDQPINLILNGQSKPGSFSADPNSNSLDTLYFTATTVGWNQAEIALDDYPITYDDRYFIAFEVVEKIGVTVINEAEPSPFLSAVYSDPATFELQNQRLSQLDYSRLEGVELIVLNNLNSIPSGLSNALVSFVEQGGNLAIFPGLEISPDGYQQLLASLEARQFTVLRDQQQSISGINTDEQIFRDVFERIPDNMAFTSASRYYGLTNATGSGEEVILSLKDGSSFMSKYNYGRGKLYLFNAPLDKSATDLQFHALFVPLMYKVAVLSARADQLAYTLGANNSMLVNDPGISGDETFKVRKSDMEFIPQQQSTSGGIRLWIQSPEQGGPREAGIYEIIQEATGYRSLIALNYDRKESEMEFYDAGELESSFGEEVNVIEAGEPGELKDIVRQLERGTALWKLCLILALVFLGLEILLLRLNISR